MHQSHMLLAHVLVWCLTLPHTQDPDPLKFSRPDLPAHQGCMLNCVSPPVSSPHPRPSTWGNPQVYSTCLKLGSGLLLTPLLSALPSQLAEVGTVFYLKRYRKKTHEVSSITWLKHPDAHNSQCWHRPKPGASSGIPTWVRKTQTLGPS